MTNEAVEQAAPSNTFVAYVHTTFQYERILLNPNAGMAAWLEKLFGVTRTIRNHFVRQLSPLNNQEAKLGVQTTDEMEDSLARLLTAAPNYSFLLDQEAEYLDGGLRYAQYLMEVFAFRNGRRPEVGHHRDVQVAHLLDTTRLRWTSTGIQLPGAPVLLEYAEPYAFPKRPTALRLTRTTHGQYHLSLMWDSPSSVPEEAKAARVALGVRLSLARKRYYQLRNRQADGCTIDTVRLKHLRSELYQLRLDALEHMEWNWYTDLKLKKLSPITP